MSNGNDHINYTVQDIEKYFLGRLSRQEMHAMEKAALDDPFLAEAMEGYEAVKDKDWQEQFLLAQKQVASAGTGAKVIPMNKPATRWWRVAAAILLIGTGATLTFLFSGRDKTEKASPGQIAQAKETPATSGNTERTPDSKQSSPSSSQSILSLNETTPITEEKKAAGTIAKTENGSESRLDDKFRTRPLNGFAADSSKQSQNDLTFKKTDTESAGVSSGRTTAAPVSLGYGSEKNIASIPKSKENVLAGNEQDILKNKPASPLSARKERSQNNFFNAQVMSADNSPLPFSNISVKSGNFETYADVKGNFRLFSTDSVLTVEIRSIGYLPRTYSLKSNLPTNKVILLENEQTIKDRNEDSNGDVANRPIHKRASVLSDTAINVEPKDGWDNYNTYMANNLDITDEMIKTELHGEVELTFDVKPNGTISNVRVNKSLDPAYDEAAKRLILQGPQWKVKKGRKTSASVKVKF